MKPDVTVFPVKARDCDECHAPASVERRLVTESFVYGVEPNEVVLQTEVPVWCCRACDYCYSDGEAEAARHEAVCRHLGVLPPRGNR